MTVVSHVYVALDVVSNDMTSDVSAPAPRFQETRNAPCVEGDSADYLCSITRFSIQTSSSLPVFIPRFELGQTEVDKTVCAITLKVTAGAHGVESHSFTRPVKYFSG